MKTQPGMLRSVQRVSACALVLCCNGCLSDTVRRRPSIQR